MRFLVAALLMMTGCLSESKKKDPTPPPSTSSENSETVTLQVDLPPSDRAKVDSSIVEFVIPSGTGNKSWNESSQRLVLFQGQTLRIRNQDSIPHQLHTADRPCAHGEVIKPGEAGDCVLTQTFDVRTEGPLYSHEFPEARFWLTVLPNPVKITEAQCISCHSSARAQGGLDLTNTPPASGSSQLVERLKERLSAEAPAERRMPPSRPALPASEIESLVAWAEAGFPNISTGSAAGIPEQELRWRLLLDGNVQTEGTLSRENPKIVVTKDSRIHILQIEEKQGASWKLIQEFQVQPDRDQTLTVETNQLRKVMPDGYYSIEDFHRFALENQVTSVADFLSRLPREFRLNYVLMKESGSRHLASSKYPRGITFSRGARVFIAFSSHPDDPLREKLELAEALENGTWKFRELGFTNKKPELSQDDNACQSCHTANLRPIWGAYPEWPGALGDEGGRVSSEEFALLKSLPTDPSTRDRFGFLQFELRDSTQAFYLPERSYNYANTVLNFELGRRASYTLYRRLKEQADHKVIFAEMLLQDECSENQVQSPRVQNYLTAGDLRLDLTASRISRETSRSWNEGNNYLTQLVNFWGLMDLLASDAILAEIFAPVRGDLESYAQMRDSSGRELPLERGNYVGFRPSQYTYPLVLGDSQGLPDKNPAGSSVSTRRQEFCMQLQKIVKNP
jgi:hypothetical protein